MEYFGFEDMDLQQGLLRAISEKGYAEPTPIQELAIPAALAGHDVMGQAQTGTGKTASFGIPILNRIVPGKGLQGLILCPTRELAVQVSEEINSLGIYLSIYTLAVYGGQAITIQFKGLEKNPEIIVATPGRIMDHMNRRSIDLQTLEFIVLDEADEMLDMGFLPDIEKILRNCPKKRQTSLFSATLSERIRNLGKKFMNNPQVFSVSSGECTIAEIQYCFYEVNSQRKLETLCKIIDVKAPASCLIFCRTKRSVGKLAGMLKRYGYSAGALHGDMSQSERDHVMRKFRSNKLSILVATDLAARGLDIDVVSHVINFDLPEAPDIFIHRTGRTGRAGRSGEAITLVDE
ncbi:MAG: DEAD/DEAH box helicase, partial [Syntrophomonadaceae bacterium]|nr:DEAD/DEAH box helicase [Syntrophomonadaceae bacterium]